MSNQRSRLKNKQKNKIETDAELKITKEPTRKKNSPLTMAAVNTLITGLQLVEHTKQAVTWNSAH
jgi:hypothetical protein